MKNFFAAFALIAAGLVPAQAQERVLTPEKAAGFDGVITQCISFTKAGFANSMCEPLTQAVATHAQRAGLRHEDLGFNQWGFGTDEYLESSGTYGIESPVYLTYYIRGTDNPVAAFVWLSLYTAAPDGRRTVLWEDSGIGAGEAGTITRGLSGGLGQKLAPVFQALGANKAD